MSVDEAKVRRETMRWNVIVTLNNAYPIGAYEEVVLSVARAIYPDATRNEVRRELGYLEDRELVEIERQPDGRWHAELTRYGVDCAEYTIDCQPGIARPIKYYS